MQTTPGPWSTATTPCFCTIFYPRRFFLQVLSERMSDLRAQTPRAYLNRPELMIAIELIGGNWGMIWDRIILPKEGDPEVRPYTDGDTGRRYTHRS